MHIPLHTDGSYVLSGERHPAVDDQTLDVISPVDGSTVGRVHEFTPEEIDAVFGLAVRHQAKWRDTSPGERARVLGDAGEFLEGAHLPLGRPLVLEVAQARKG